MQYFRLSCISLLTLLYLQPIDAQQVYYANKYGGPGTIYLYNSLFGFNQDSMIQQSGADVTWDLSSAISLNTHPTEIVTKEEAFDFFTFLTICGLGGTGTFECLNTWNNTDQAWLVQDTISLFQFTLTDLQRYQRKSSNYLFENFLGFKADLGGTSTSAVIVYSNPDTILHFPVIYGENYTSAIQWNIDLNPVGQAIKYESHQSRTTSVDAWGDVITPFQTFENVVRMRSVVHRQDSLTTDSLAVPITVTQVEYMWFDTSYKLPIMIANGIITDSSEVLGTLEYLYDKTCAAPTWDAVLSTDTYIIDSTGSVMIDFIIENGNADEYTWDWGDGEFTTTTGSTTHTYTEPGEYVIGVTGCMTNCLPLNSCSYDILEFIVLSDGTIPGEEAGIKIYPNPVNEEINLFLPEAIGSSHFVIFDMNGRALKEGDLKAGRNQIESDFAPGMYAVRVVSIDGKRNLDYILRYIVPK